MLCYASDAMLSVLAGGRLPWRPLATASQNGLATMPAARSRTTSASVDSFEPASSQRSSGAS